MSRPSPTFRPVCPEDRDFLFRVYASTRLEELALTHWDEAQKQAFLVQQFEAQDHHYRTHYPGARLDLIVLDDEPIGRLYVARWKDEIRIMDIALLPEHRNRGIGGRLLRELLEEAAATGRRLTIHVERYNPALRLYRRLGFAPVGETGVYLLLAVEPPANRPAGALR
ncbi:MAG: GNAT family N-acetyltransferase [Candidatus Contendobacter sp.]|nr:GNAT family N-acetyltransferase [Candidatus Contendobacter sp.]MDG4558244.1 GNAT family N-acetyltransferase [Candidatus Contendobacter sp.]